MQEIQFLEFMGGSNLTNAHSNYLICMRFIQTNKHVFTSIGYQLDFFLFFFAKVASSYSFQPVSCRLPPLLLTPWMHLPPLPCSYLVTFSVPILFVTLVLLFLYFLLQKQTLDCSELLMGRIYTSLACIVTGC